MSNFRRRLLLTNQTDKDLYLYGNSVQDGTPAPETPIDIMSLENPIIKTTGNNLFKPTIEGEIVSAGITIRLNDDNSITLNGGPATSGGYKTIGVLMMQANKIYTMSGAIGGSWENSY